MFTHPETVTGHAESGTISHSTRSLTPRLLAGAILLGAVSLLVPAAAQAQGIRGEEAFLNRRPDVSHNIPSGNAAQAATVDGARALLGRSTGGVPGQAGPELKTSEAGYPIDGERALLSRTAAPAARRISLE